MKRSACDLQCLRSAHQEITPEARRILNGDYANNQYRNHVPKHYEYPPFLPKKLVYSATIALAAMIGAAASYYYFSSNNSQNLNPPSPIEKILDGSK